jgi:hypothetical protein
MGLLSSLFGGSKSRTVNNPSTVWGGQAPFLTNLYGQGQGLAQQQSQTIGQDAAGLSQGLLGGLGPYSNAATNPAFQNLLQRAQGGSPYLGQQIQGLGNDIGQFFSQQILPGIQSQYGLGGTLGGSRQSIAQGMASQDAIRQFSQGATNLRQADYGQGLQAAAYLGDLSQQQIGNLGNMYNLSMSPYMAQWSPYQSLSGIIGSPTVLGGGGNSRMTDQSGIFQPI